jgi:signal transduction histidine kinase
MAGAEHILLQQFEVAAIAAPPALLCLQLLRTSSAQGASTGPDQSSDMEALVLQNPALLVRVLDAQYKQHNRHDSLSFSERLQQLDTGWLHSLLTDMALQLVLAGSKRHHLFHQLHWQEARRTALLARTLAERCGVQDTRRVEMCALLLDCGMLVLEQKHGAAWVGLYLEIAQQRRLLDAERQTLGLDHIDAGIELLRGWQMEQDCIDALRYQAVALDEVLDATPLVRLVWLARQLNTAGPAARAQSHAAAAALFNLDADTVDALMQDARAQFSNELRSWGAGTQVQERHLSDLAQQRFDQDQREELQRLQWQLLSESALLVLENLDVSSSDSLRGVLARALQQAGVEPRFVLLATAPGQQRLQVLEANKVSALPPELGLQLVPGRSALADLVLAGDLAMLTQDHNRLTVIDRQLLDLLGGSFLCEPVQTAAGRMVLLLAGSQLYPQRRLVRAFVQRKLAAFHGAAQPATATGSVDTLLYRQRVREAVHEANNPLAIIKNYLQILHMKQGDTGAAKEIRIINTEIDRVAGILAALREPTAPAQTQAVDLNALLRSLHPVFAQAFSAEHPVDIRLDLADDPLTVQAQPDALKQILTNLVKNAAESFTQGGSIVLATRRNVYQNETLYLQLSVADDGPGMSPAQLATLFVAGNTTKGREHSGAGLAIVKRLVDAMAGQITCQSDSKGTVISILLPQRP